MALKIVIVGGGWAGCAAAYMAAKQGAHVVLTERTDMLLGTGLVGGIMNNNGRLTVAKEMSAMGGGDIFSIIEGCLRHKNVDFPGHRHGAVYDIVKTPTAIYQYLLSLNVDLRFNSRIVSVSQISGKINAVEDSEGNIYEGDVFIDTTGSAGPVSHCRKYGNGCAMCIMRCPSFGGRKSLIGMAGIKEEMSRKEDGQIGAMSGSCKIHKESLSKAIADDLNRKGVVVIPIPEALVEDHLGIKSCQQYALDAYAKNIVLLDTGHAKMMAPFYPLAKLRQIPGFENARYEDPYAGGLGNSMRFFAVAPRDNQLKVIGLENVFCGGEKAGLLVGHTEAIISGILAGYNATMYASGRELLIFPRSLAIGEGIAYINERLQKPGGLEKKYTYSGSVLLDHIRECGLYTIDDDEIINRVKACGMKDFFVN